MGKLNEWIKPLFAVGTIIFLAGGWYNSTTGDDSDLSVAVSAISTEIKTLSQSVNQININMQNMVTRDAQERAIDKAVFKLTSEFKEADIRQQKSIDKLWDTLGKTKI